MMNDETKGSPADEAARKRELLEKIKDASNGPEHAKRRVRAARLMFLLAITVHRSTH